MKRFAGFAAAVALVLCAVPAMAHFQMIYTPTSVLEKGATIPVRLVFTHPFEAGHTMDMGVQEFFVVHKEKKTDLKGDLKPIKWTSLTNKGDAFAADVKCRSMGDYAFGLVPAPYYEPSEDLWMQQCTKMIVNVGATPTDWDQPIGLPVEILPLAKPYGLWKGNVFVGVVTADGKPVPNAEIEVEYLNHAPDLKKNCFVKKAAIEDAKEVFFTQTIKADANGTFVYALPKAGWWGFAALEAATVQVDGHDVEQDAVLWVEVTDLK